MAISSFGPEKVRRRYDNTYNAMMLPLHNALPAYIHVNIMRLIRRGTILHYLRIFGYPSQVATVSYCKDIDLRIENGPSALSHTTPLPAE